MGKYLKEGENSKNLCIIGISVKKYPWVPEFIQIGSIILVENAFWSSAQNFPQNFENQNTALFLSGDFMTLKKDNLWFLIL